MLQTETEQPNKDSGSHPCQLYHVKTQQRTIALMDVAGATCGAERSVVAGLSAVDAVILVVDATEGVYACVYTA